ncbi:ABC transporter substrate-binding protein [Salana multivorans]
MDEAFPVTVETGYGEITLTEKPERIVVLAAQYSDILGAMDVVPVVTSISPGLADADSVVAAFPWLEGVDLGDVDDTLIGADYAASLEAIAAHEPDLILANTWQVTEETFPRISEIAPTFTGTYYGNNDWNVLTEALGVLTGEEEAAVAAISGLEDTYAEVRAQFPELEGLTYYTTRYDTNGFGFGNGSWLDGFGMKPGERQDKHAEQRDPGLTGEHRPGRQRLPQHLVLGGRPGDRPRSPRLRGAAVGAQRTHPRVVRHGLRQRHQLGRTAEPGLGDRPDRPAVRGLGAAPGVSHRPAGR